MTTPPAVGHADLPDGAAYHGRMGAEPHDAAARRRPSDDPGRDAMWRPGGGVAIVSSAAPDPVSRPADDEPPRPRRPVGGPVSPWSREAIEAPLPSVDEIRERWRTELGLDHAAPREPDPLVRPRRDDDTPLSTSTGAIVLGAVVVALLLVLAGGVVWTLRPSGNPTATSAGVLPAVDGAPTWTLPLPDRIGPFTIGAGVLAMSVGDELVVRELDTGEVRWAAPVESTDGVRRVMVDATAIMLADDFGTSAGTAVVAFDPDTGDVLWERRASDEVTLEFLQETLVEISEPAGGDRIVRVVDTATGEPMGAGVVADAAPPPPGFVVGRVGGDLALLDLATGEVVAPAVPAFGLRSIAPVGGHVVGFTEDNEIVAFDDDGVAVDRRLFVSDAFGDFAGRAELVGGVPGTSLGIVASGTSVGFEVVGGRIEARWELEGRVFGPGTETEVGPVSVARLVDPETGLVQMAIVDVRDGSVVATTDAAGDREAAPLLFADGWIAAPVIGDPDRVVTAFGYGGDERWSLPLERDPFWWGVDDGVFVVLFDRTLVAYG